MYIFKNLNSNKNDGELIIATAHPRSAPEGICVGPADQTGRPAVINS